MFLFGALFGFEDVPQRLHALAIAGPQERLDYERSTTKSSNLNIQWAECIIIKCGMLFTYTLLTLSLNIQSDLGCEPALHGLC